MDEYYQAASALPQPLAGALAALSPRIAPFVQEIRLRVGQGVQFTVQGQLSPAGKYLPELNEKISEETLKNCFLQLCRHSVYAYEDELSRGYFTLPGGSRVGVAGCRGGRGFGRVTSLNLRIARPVLCSLPTELTDFLAAPTGGVLVVGVPGSGKTTFLRSVLQYLIEQRQIVAVADERGELTGVDCKGKMLVSPGCDVYTRCSKAAAVEMSLRCMNPRFILCDELGTAEDAAALEWGVASGVVFAASVHCESLRALQNAPSWRGCCKRAPLRGRCCWRADIAPARSRNGKRSVKRCPAAGIDPAAVRGGRRAGAGGSPKTGAPVGAGTYLCAAAFVYRADAAVPAAARCRAVGARRRLPGICRPRRGSVYRVGKSSAARRPARPETGRGAKPAARSRGK